MRRKLPFILFLLLVSYNLLRAQSQYRSPGTGVTVDLSSATNWQVFSGGSWITATTAPTGLASGSTILIQANDRWQNLSATVTIVPIGVTLTNNSSVVPVAADFAAGKISIAGTLVYSGVSAQTMPFVQAFVSSTIAGNLTIDNLAGVMQGSSGTGSTFFTLNGILYLQNGQYTCNTGPSNFNLKGSIQSGNGKLKVALFNAQGAAAQTLSSTDIVNSTFNNFTVNNAAGVTTSGSFIIPALFYLKAGTLTLGGSLTIKASGANLLNASTVGGIVAGSNPVIFSGSAHQAVQAVNFFANNSVNNLTITNTTGVTYPASLTIGNSFAVKLATGVTPLAVIGTATIGGALTISSFATAPAPGQVYTIVSGSTAVNGTFSNLTLPAGYTGTLTYSDTDVKLTVTPAASSNANLSSLILSTGTLSPAFDANTTSYGITVPNATTSLLVTPTTHDGTATVKVNGITVTSGHASSPITLNVGNNTITIVVTAQDGTTTKTYTTTVTRQSALYSFDTGIPANFTASGSTLTSSTTHIKSGHSLAWNVTDGAVLTATSLGITSAQTGNFSTSSAQFYIYNAVASNDTLVFNFYTNGNNTPQRVGHMLLNFTGWRDYHRSYRFDYNNGQDGGSGGFALDKMTITYRPVNNGATPTIYLDEFTMVGDANEREPGPYMQIDLDQFKTGNGYAYLEPTQYFLNAPPTSAPPVPGTQEQTDAITVKSRYSRSIPTVTDANVTIAENYVSACGIYRNVDGSINGTRGLLYLHNLDTLVKIGTYVGYLTQAAVKNNDNTAKAQLLLFTEYLLDQGLAEGGRNNVRTNDYTHAQNLPVGFLQAVKSGLLTDSLNKGIIKMLKWSNGYNIIYNTAGNLWVETDFIVLKATFLLELAGYSTPDYQVRDYHDCSSFLSLFTNIHPGAEDGIKPDGLGFHHNFNNVPYFYAWGTYADRANSLKGTVYKITPQAFSNMSLAFKALYLPTAPGASLVLNSSSGRHPFTAFTEVPKSKFQEMVAVGGDIKGTTFDTELAQLYNYIYKTNFYAVPAKNYDSVYHYNYAQLGVKRKGNWIAGMKGFTNTLLGSEIYDGANRYGRYQSYGALEVLYDGGMPANGWIANGAGWDWNAYPGTTNVQLPWSSLQPTVSTVFDFQTNSFAGALSLGAKDGIFAMDFLEKNTPGFANNGLSFKKSVFVFDSVMVCLGSSISSTNSSNITSTNLFQAIDTAANFTPIYVNSTSPISGATYSNTLSTAANSAWMVTGQTTGYYIPKNGGTVTVARGSQTTPDQSDMNQSVFNTANYSKAYISHGNAPSNATYQFVVVPGTTPAAMQTLAGTLDGGNIYAVLKQTDSLHVVFYKPDSTTSYAFFKPNSHVNIGYVNSISNKGLLGIQKKGDTLMVTVNNPDLNVVTDESDVIDEWHAVPQDINLVLNGNWTVIANSSNASISSVNNTLTAGFTLKDGFSGSLTLVVFKPPVVALTAPADHSIVMTGSNITINANASSPNTGGNITKVDFYNGPTLLGTSTAAPYSFNWANVTAGTNTLTAVATDNMGLTTTSSILMVTVSAPPTVTLTAPASNSIVAAGSNITISADAGSPNTDSNITKVDFYNGPALLGTSTTAPYSYTWDNATAGTDTLTAVATDNNGFTKTSANSVIRVNAPPTISITTPVANAKYNAPASVTISADAADADGSVSKVEFFQGATKLGEALTAPYSFNWADVVAGNYAITAKATDNNGLATTSVVTNINVICPQVQLTIPDVYAMNPSVDAKNTIYIGYGPTSLTITALAQDGQDYTYSWSTGENTPSISVSQAGTYTVTVSCAAGCQYSASITINMLDVRCGNNNDKVQICHNQHVICVAPSAVQAHLDHGDKLGACDVATLAINNTNGLINRPEEPANSTNVAVYPNPVHEYLHISVPKLEANAVIHVYSYATPGKEVRAFRFININQVMSFQGLAPGYYFLVIKNGNQIIKRTIIKN